MPQPPPPSVPQPLVVVHVRGKAGFTPPRKFVHPNHHISILLRAEGYYRAGQMELPLGQPLISLLPAGDDDVNGLKGEVEGWYAGFRWPGMRFRRLGRQQLRISWGSQAMQTPRFKPLDGASITRLVELYRSMQGELSRQDLAGSMRARALLMELFAGFLDMPGGPGAPLAHRALARFRDLLRGHACESVRMENLAEEAGVSADHVRDLFRRQFGLRPVAYRTNLRLEKAHELLASTALSVKEVSARVGYEDPLYFSRVFKHHYGISPNAVIRRYRLN